MTLLSIMKPCARSIYISTAERTGYASELNWFLFQTNPRSGEYCSNPSRGGADLFHAGHLEILRSQDGSYTFHQNRIPASFFHRSFRRRLRDRLRTSHLARALDEGSSRSAVNRDFNRDRHHQNSGIIPRESGILV